MHLQSHVMMGWCAANLWPGLSKRQRLGCMIISLAPDLDGLSIIAGQEAFWDWHHRVGHNLPLGLAACALLALWTRPWMLSFIVYVLLFHLHLLTDMLGSGPGWGIYYLWPFSGRLFDNTHISWEFYSVQNISAAIALLAMTIAIVFWKRRTPLEAIMPALDQKMVRWITRRP